MSKPYTPAIPPLSSIKDEGTRRVLEALISGWRVRNGEAQPESDERFVRKGELQKLSEQATVKYFSTAAGAQALGSAIAGNNALGEYIRNTIDDLERSVVTSQLWRRLGERLNLIDPPQIFTRIGNVETILRREVTRLETADEAILGVVDTLGTRVGDNEAGLLGEVDLRTNSDNALASAINTIWATVGNATGLVQEGTTISTNAGSVEATNWTQVQAAIKDPVTNQLLSTAAVRDEARAVADDITGVLTAERTLKVDVNGYVAGIGIIANADRTSGPISSSIVMRADQFAIGAPSDTLNTPAYVPGGTVPFIVRTTPTTLNGKQVPAGVYIRDAIIQNGSIGTAQIGVAQVDTLILAGNAVTVPVFNTSSSSVTITNYSSDGSTDTWYDIVSVVINYGTAEQGVTTAKGLVGFTIQHGSGGGGYWAIRWRVRRGDGTTIGFGEQSVSNNDVGKSTVSAVVFDNAANNGSRTYTLQIANWGNVGSARVVDAGAVIYGIGAKR